MTTDNGLKMPAPLSREHKGRLRTEELEARFKWIKEFIALNFISPTYQEMGDAWGGISKSAVSETIERMERYGWISQIGQSPRSIRLVRDRGDNEHNRQS